MCINNGTDKLFNVQWQKELPDSEGEWLWIKLFSCGCVSNSGICWVTNKDEYDAENFIELPNGLLFSWESSKYYGQSIEHMTAWAKIELPPISWGD